MRLDGGSEAPESQAARPVFDYECRNAYDPVPAAPVARRKKEPVKLNDWRENIRYPLSIVGAFLVGLFAVVVARFARFHMAGGGLTGDEADFLMIVDGGLAFGLAFVLRSMFNFEAPEHLAAKTAGVAVTVSEMHSFVHMAPGLWTLAFSPEWVEGVLLYSEPMSVLFRGISFTF